MRVFSFAQSLVLVLEMSIVLMFLIDLILLGIGLRGHGRDMGATGRRTRRPVLGVTRHPHRSRRTATCGTPTRGSNNSSVPHNANPINPSQGLANAPTPIKPSLPRPQPVKSLCVLRALYGLSASALVRPSFSSQINKRKASQRADATRSSWSY